MEKFFPAPAYLFCLPLSGSCLARFAYFLADLCISNALLAVSVPPKDPDDLVEIVERLSKTEGREETLALLRALQKALR